MEKLSPQEIQVVTRLLNRTNLWQPLPKQKEALESKADVLFYGGAAGGGKTDLLIAAAMLEHHDSIIFRREFKELRGIIKRANQIYDGFATYNKNECLYTFDCGKFVSLGSVQYEDDKDHYQGVAHDLKAFDEITGFTESQFRYLCGWCRTARKNQRTRVIVAGNPPMDSQGEWVIRYWAPWLDPNYPNPAKSGELRWFITDDNEDREVPNGDPIRLNGEMVAPRSRTFIQSKVQDNEYMMESGYMAVLQAHPEPLRSKLLNGDFSASEMRGQNQIIPTEWVVIAQNRWLKEFKDKKELTAFGIDVARGGADRTVLTLCYDNRMFDRQVIRPGYATPTGEYVVGLVNAYIGEHSDVLIYIDNAGIGVDAYECLRKAGFNVFGTNAASKSYLYDKSGTMGFKNKRAEMWWKMREALDPTGDAGICLPPDDELKRELITPRWKELDLQSVAQVESKTDIKKRIGKSPDKADSLLLAFCSTYDSISSVKTYYSNFFNR